MRLTLKDSIYQILFPLLAVGTVIIIFNITSLTFKKFIGILLAMFLISFIGGLIIYFLYLLIDKYQNGILDQIRKRFSGTKTRENIVMFNYDNIEVFGELTMNNMMQHQFNFHVPRKYIQKRHRKNVEFMKPSNVSGEECFQILSWLYINKRRLKILEDKLDAIVEINKQE